MPFGFLNVYKPKGITSHDVVNKLRKITGIKQIGHTGTLDPFAQGVLPICIGKATRLIEYLSDDKEYLATVQFGANTDTYDIEGKVTETFDKKINNDELVLALKKFEGEISQIPPIYSAIKKGGKKLYEYARNNEKIEIEPRKINIYKIELKEFDEVKNCAKILISCSKGTYIRSIAYDLGKILGSGGYLTDLVRTKAGKFFVENSIKLEDFESEEIVLQNLINPLKMLDLPQTNISDDEHKKVVCGQSFMKNFSQKSVDFLILVYNNNISAVANCENGEIKVKKVFL